MRDARIYTTKISTEYLYMIEQSKSGIAIKLLLFIAKQRKCTRGQLVYELGIEFKDLELYLDLAEMYELIIEKDGFYRLANDTPNSKVVLHFINAKIPKKDLPSKQDSLTQTNKRANQTSTTKPAKRTAYIHRGSNPKDQNYDTGAFFGGASHGFRTEDWNDEIALWLPNELKRLGELRKQQGENGFNDFDRMAMK